MIDLADGLVRDADVAVMCWDTPAGRQVLEEATRVGAWNRRRLADETGRLLVAHRDALRKHLVTDIIPIREVVFDFGA